VLDPYVHGDADQQQGDERPAKSAKVEDKGREGGSGICQDVLRYLDANSPNAAMASLRTAFLRYLAQAKTNWTMPSSKSDGSQDDAAAG